MVHRRLPASPRHRVRRVDVGGKIDSIAGDGSAGFGGDDGPATLASLSAPTGVAVDRSNRIYIADAGNHRIRRIDSDDTIRTMAGDGEPGFAGDGGPAELARLQSPRGLAVDATGRVLIADSNNNRVRRIDLDGTIETIAGGGGSTSCSDEGVTATAACLAIPEGVTVDTTGRVVIADTQGHRVRMVAVDGTISSVAGSGVTGGGGDGGPASAATLRAPAGVAVDAPGPLAHR